MVNTEMTRLTLDLLNHMDYGVNAVDQEFNILFMNEASRQKFGITDGSMPTLKCHELLFNNPEPCANCPVLAMGQSGDNFGQIVGVLNIPERPNHRVRYHRLSDGRFVQTLTDITRETELVRQVSLQSKETQAQNIILKRKRQELEEHTAFLNSVFNAIQSGILVLDSSSVMNISSSNRAVLSFLRIEDENSINKKKCYQLFGFQNRCPGCPIEQTNERTNFNALRFNQKVGDFTLTEYYARLPDGKILLIFEDSTKRVHLLTQVKEHKEIIERQNQIFRTLLETSTLIQTTAELHELFTSTLAQLSDLFVNLNFGFILDGERPEILECAVFKGFNELEEKVVMESKAELLEENIEAHLLEQFKKSEEYAKDPNIVLPTNWLVLPMKGRERKTIGKMVINGAPLDQQSIEIVSVFLEQVTAVAENKLLTRQLERMANTDALTGAYNRAFFTREITRSIDNAMRFQNIQFTVMLIDVNGLKRVNDVYGHGEGDNMIIRVAQLLTQVCRKTDVVTRLGGDEFVVLCPATGYAKAEVLLSRIREKEAETSMVCKNADGTDEVIPIRMSIGVASSEDITPEEVLKSADTRMYADKQAFYATRQKYR